MEQERNASRARLDPFDPFFILLLVYGGVIDAVFLPLGPFALIGAPLFAPIHFLLALPVGIPLFFKLRHLVPKLIFLFAMMLPLSGVMVIGVLLAILTQNRLIEFAVTQAAILAVGAVSGGLGAAAGEAAELQKVQQLARRFEKIRERYDAREDRRRGVGAAAGEAAELQKVQQLAKGYDVRDDRRTREPTLPEMLGEPQSEYERLSDQLFPERLENIPGARYGDDNVEVGDDGTVDLRRTA